MKRKRGGQPGNQNALKHSVYPAGSAERRPVLALRAGSPLCTRRLMVGTIRSSSFHRTNARPSSRDSRLP